LDENDDDKERGQGKRQAEARTDSIIANATRMIAEGRQTFRFDTFGDESFFGVTRSSCTWQSKEPRWAGSDAE
jgi:hypothetical protein